MLKRLLILSLFFAIVIAACSKKEDPAPTGTLTLVAQDSADNALDSITFTLYADQATYNSKTNPIATMMSDANGTAVFTGITKDNLWVRAVKAGLWSNAAGGPTSSRNISGVSTSGATTKIILVHDVRPACLRTNRGTVTINNTTANTYSISVDGTATGITVPASDAAFLVTGPAGTVNFTFIRTNTMNPTGPAVIEKAVSIVTCGNTTVTLP